ncbi:hypothetical protein KK092_07270 [Curtobacterium flaccumfaciens pv. flaccumfaciens]|uniref:hypothetical protein n=1 Tax=Curtobacterium flaccumfaciens TaxID=2035 RepID=UPI001BDEF334|nr:hypothetical protein [Curtobacterium flaccumfaciens]MBT1669177.1 hypothetical protein [Curtobacterium flaccumfaciens pv. flaccumfaciens]
MGTITGTGGGEGLVFSANGSTGAGDDVQVTVDHSSIDGSNPTTESTIVPWKTGTGAYDLDKPKTVTMQVRSLAKSGWASCEIRWSGKSITNKATGNHAQANCTATLGYPWSKTDD